MEKVEPKLESKREEIQEVDEVKFEDLEKDEEEILEAKIPGGFSKFPEEWHYQSLEQGKKGAQPIPKEIVEKVGPTPGIIRKRDNQLLEFKDINYKNRFEETKSGKRKAFATRKGSSHPIRKILLVKKKKEE